MLRRKHNTTDPYEIVTWDGVHKVDQRTYTYLKAVERKTKMKIQLAQGSYNRGVEASKGTHDMGGVVDVSTAGLSPKQRVKLMHGLKVKGGFGWFRHGPVWVGNEHIHVGLRKHKNLAWIAARQEIAYDNRRNGLADNAADRTWRPRIRRHWSHRRNRVVLEF